MSVGIELLGKGLRPWSEALRIALAVTDFIEIGSSRNFLPGQAIGKLGKAALSLHPYLIALAQIDRSEEHTSELQSLMRISYAVFCLKKKKNKERKRMYTQQRST